MISKLNHISYQPKPNLVVSSKPYAIICLLLFAVVVDGFFSS